MTTKTRTTEAISSDADWLIEQIEERRNGLYITSAPGGKVTVHLREAGGSEYELGHGPTVLDAIANLRGKAEEEDNSWQDLI